MLLSVLLLLVVLLLEIRIRSSSRCVANESLVEVDDELPSQNRY